MAKAGTPTTEAGTSENEHAAKKTDRKIGDADVARRAYTLYLARGRGDGHDVEDWLQAEDELRDRAAIDA